MGFKQFTAVECGAGCDSMDNIDIDGELQHKAKSMRLVNASFGPGGGLYFN